MAHDTQDDGFREIQLNGKQLVFLFMAATVVTVVIFLCGVYVGRGVRAERGESAADAAVLNAPRPDALPPAAAAPAPAAPAGADPTAVAPPPAVEDLSYFTRLEKPEAPAERLKSSPDNPAAAAPAAKTVVEEPRTPSPAPKEPVAKVTDAAPREPAAVVEGYVLQVAALRERAEADAIARRLSSKGYAAYVLSPSGGTPSVFRVRVGTFKTRREAEAVAAKLEKEEQFKPWITR
jgi:cell division septation protein DedD